MSTSHQPRSVAAIVHGRYLLVPATDPEARRLLVGFHGYAENAARHMAELEQLPTGGNWSLASVQALHPFYNTRTQEIVASWMTSLDREAAIADNVEFIRSVLRSIRIELPAAEVVVFAGFSQGASMAYRAAAAIPCAGIISLGGDVPPDVKASGQFLPPTLIARGRSDDYYSKEKLTADLDFLVLNSEPVICEFDGGHEWTADFRLAAGEFLSRF